ELDLFLVSARKDPASCVLTSATRTKVSHIISRILKKECCVSKIPFSINAGVVIFDCEWSHEVSFFSCFINIYQELIKNKDPIQFYEQAAAALIFQNLHDGFYLLDKEYNLYGRHEYISSKLAKKDPAIIHYIGGVKPWEMDFASYLRRSESLRNNSPDLPYVNWLWLSYAKQHEDIVSATPIPDLTPEQVYYLGQTYFKIESEPAKIQRHKEYSDE
ncbi:MAG: hypothetical protein JJU24_18980, partial [Natronohydrobacter sp.]|nr:hypothetical protein [Natronohydrobacter sp.]